LPDSDYSPLGLLRTVTVYVDAKAGEDLYAHKVTPKDILEEVMRIYQVENGLMLRYDLDRVKVKHWKRDFLAEAWIFFLRTLAKVSFFYQVCKKELDLILFEEAILLRGEDRTNVSLFLSGLMLTGNGFAPIHKGKAAGNGVMVVGTDDAQSINGYALPVTDFSRLDYRLKLALVTAHEQGHLFGLWHATKGIMYQIANSDVKFDELSRAILARKV